MAGVTQLGDGAPPSSGHGIFGSLARAQYSALAGIRWQLFRRGLRTVQGAFEFGAALFAQIMFGVLGLALGFGMGAAAYAIVSNHALEWLPVLFWVLFAMWQLVPITLASFQEQFDINGLLRFPVSFGSFFLMHLIFGLVDVSTIMGAFASFGIWLGITVARPGLFAWAALALIVFAAFNIFLVRAIFAWIDRWLAQRRTREIVSALFLVAVLGVQLFNPALRAGRHTGKVSAATRAASERWLARANTVQFWLPPGLASGVVQRADAGQGAPALGALCALGAFGLFTGGVLATRIRAEYRGENLGDAPVRKTANKRARAWLIDGSGPIAALMEKELRTLLRSMPMLYALGAPIFMVFIFGALFRNAISPGSTNTPPAALPLMMAYAVLGFTQLIYNNLGGEAAGVQLYFLSPTPMRTVLLAKNLFCALIFALDTLVVGVIASFRFGPPGGAIVAATVAWLLFALPIHLGVGNVLSIVMPYKMNLGRITRRKGSQANALLSVLVQVVVFGVGAGVFAACYFTHVMWLAAPVLLILALGSSLVWWRLLNRCAELAFVRREGLITTLLKAD